MSLQARYTILRKIADGGTAEIFLANQRGVHGFEKLVVLKRIFPAFYADPQFRNMLVDEARIAMSLNHSNIVQVLDLGEEEGQYILALELVDGWTLDAVIRRVRAARSSMPPALALHVTAEVCRALAYAHAKMDADGKPLGIVHRDISPHNVLLSEQGEVKLTDFGIATAGNQREEGGDKIIRGKIAYMSPEQASGATLDARSDLFSVGTMLYVMLCGRFPFDAATDLELLLLVKSGRYVPPEQARPGLHPELVRLLNKLMDPDVAARYQGADEVLADVEQIMRTTFKAVGQTELKRWLQDLSIRDGVAPLTKASPATATGQTGRVLGSGRDAKDAGSAAAHSIATVPARVPPPVPPAARAVVSSGGRPPPPPAAMAIGRRPATAIMGAAKTGASGPITSGASALASSSAAGTITTASVGAAGSSYDDDGVEELTPEPYEPTPGPVVVAALEAGTARSGPIAATSPGEPAAAAETTDARERASEVTAQGDVDPEFMARHTRPTPGPTQPALIALSSTATVPPASKIVPPPPTGHSGMHAIPPPPVASEILKGLGTDPLLGPSFNRGGGAAGADAPSTAFPGAINTLPAAKRPWRGLVIGGGLVGLVVLLISVKTCAGEKGKTTEEAAAHTASPPPSATSGKSAPTIEPVKPSAPAPAAAVAIAQAPMGDDGGGPSAPEAGGASPASASQAASPEPAGGGGGAAPERVVAAVADASARTAAGGADAIRAGEPPAATAPEKAVAAAVSAPEKVAGAAAPTATATAPSIPAPSPGPAIAATKEAPRVAVAEPAVTAHPPVPAAEASGAAEAPSAPGAPGDGKGGPRGDNASPTGEADAGAAEAGQGDKVMVLVKSVPTGARVTTAHHDYGNTPVSIRLRPGNTYALILKADGYKPTKQRIEVTTDPDQEVTVTLKKGAGAAEATPAPGPAPAAVPAAPPASPAKPPDGQGPSWWKKMFKSR